MAELCTDVGRNVKSRMWANRNDAEQLAPYQNCRTGAVGWMSARADIG
jgi:hypothetical protein